MENSNGLLARLRILCVAVLVAALVPVSFGAGADSILSHTQRRAGICVLPQCADSALLLDLAAKSQFLIHARNSDGAVVDKLRHDLAAAGLLGRRVFVEQGSATVIPFADDDVDVVATSGAMSPELRKEAERVLAPPSGVLIAGNETWLKPVHTGTDEWPQRWHGPDNNPFSRDTAFKLPAITKWLSKPYSLTQRRCTELIAGGRIVIANRSDGAYGNDDRYDIFICYNAANGRILWKRPLPEIFATGLPNMILTGDTLYMALGPRIARLDPETGKETTPINFNGIAGHIKWLGMSDGVLMALFGAANTSTELPAKSYDWSKDLKAKTETITDTGRTLVAWDLAGGRELWRKDCGAAIAARMIAIRDGAIYYHAQDSHLAALNLRDGKERWRTVDASVLKRMHEDPDKFDGFVGSVDRGLTALPEALIIGNGGTTSITAINPANGNLLWSKTLSKGQNSEFSSNGRVVRWVADAGIIYTLGANFDARTGKEVPGVSFRTSGCGMISGSPNGFFGTCGIAYDRTVKQATEAQSELHKTPCDVGTFVAEGFMFSPGGPCTCGVVSRGIKAAVARGNIAINTRATDATRLWQASNLEAAPLPTAAGDSTTWRGATPGGFFAATVGGKPKQLWNFKPAHPYAESLEARRYDQENHPTAPVLAGGFVFFGSTDGSVRALDAASGAPRWEAWTAGPICTPPTVANGRLYVGSGDGNVYCYEAASGRALWRFRAAPQERLLGVNGFIASTWPVHTGIVIHNGVAYAGAGMLPEDGMHVYAFDAKDGHLVWQNNNLGDHPDQPSAGRSPFGGMSIAGGRLWLQCIGVAATALDLKTGALMSVPERFADPRKNQGVEGKDLFNFQNQWVLAGGQRLLADHYERVGSFIKIARWARYDFLKLDANGAPQWPALTLPNTIQAPVWDNQLFVTPTHYRSRLEGWTMAKFLPYLDTLREKKTGMKPHPLAPERAPLLTVGQKGNSVTPMRQWGPVELDVNALALTTDAVVVTHRVAARNEPDLWRLSALERATGVARWNIELPDEPLMDGLLVTGQGRIVVPLRNGGVMAFGN